MPRRSHGCRGSPAGAAAAAGTFRDCETCPEMVAITATEIIIGTPLTERGRHGDETPRRRIRFARNFAIGIHEVTFAEWDACVADGGCTNPVADDKGWGRDRRPVINVTWLDAQQFVGWLSRKTGKTYRLPSEAEWEFAARGGVETARPWTPDDDSYPACGFANVYDLVSKKSLGWPLPHHTCEDGFVGTAPVGSFKPNGFGLYDTVGNVWEWVQDCWRPRYHDHPRDGMPLEAADCKVRTMRGADWSAIPSYTRYGIRSGDKIEVPHDFTGFRVARDE